MYDYGGDMKYFQDQLERAGISKEMMDMNKFVGLTRSELQSIVDYAIKVQESKEKAI